MRMLPQIQARPLLALLAATLFLPATACVDLEAEDDPAGLLGDVPEEWEDDGPPEGDETVDAAEDEPLALYAGAPRFQLPFPCNQVWAGQTRTSHSPQNAVDFNRVNDFGDPVVASAAGTVTVVGNTGSSSYGRWIEIGHGNGYRTRYAHLSAQAVRVGQKVKRGQRIGRVGNSGGSSGPHLHYEQRRNGVTLRARFNGKGAKYFGTRNYRSRNCR